VSRPELTLGVTSLQDGGKKTVILRTFPTRAKGVVPARHLDRAPYPLAFEFRFLASVFWPARPTTTPVCVSYTLTCRGYMARARAYSPSFIRRFGLLPYEVNTRVHRRRFTVNATFFDDGKRRFLRQPTPLSQSRQSHCVDSPPQDGRCTHGQYCRHLTGAVPKFGLRDKRFFYLPTYLPIYRKRGLRSSL